MIYNIKYISLKLVTLNPGLFDVSNELVNLLVDAAQSAGARLNGLLANIAAVVSLGILLFFLNVTI